MTLLLDLGLRNAVMAALLAVAVAVVARVMRRPALAHGLWLLVLLRLVAVPIWPIPVLAALPPDVVPGPINTTDSFAPAVGGAPAMNDLDDGEALPAIDEEPPFGDTTPNLTHRMAAWLAGSGGTALAWVWLAGTLAWLGGTLHAARRFDRLLRFARRAPTALDREVHDLARRFGLSRCPGLWLVPGTVSPMLWAVGRPRLLFPADLLGRLDATQRATLFAHELAHYRRRDHWVRWLEVVVLGLYWWHPIAWWARHELREAEEQCCDAWVTWGLASADRAYATALVQTVTFLSHARTPLPVTASGIGHVRHLRRRLTMIMRGTTPRSLSWAGLLAVLAVGMFSLPLALAQSRPATEGTEEQQARPSDEIDRKIAEVQKMLRALEEQKKADTTKVHALEVIRKVESARQEERKEVSEQQLLASRRQVEESAKQVESKRAEMRAAEERHMKALADLAKLEGRDPQEVLRRYATTYQRIGTARSGTTEPMRAPGAVPATAVTPRARYVEAGKAITPPRAQNVPRAVVSDARIVGPASPATDDIARAVERLSAQLSQLAQQVEELRRATGRQEPSPRRQ